MELNTLNLTYKAQKCTVLSSEIQLQSKGRSKCNYLQAKGQNIITYCKSYAMAISEEKE